MDFKFSCEFMARNKISSSITKDVLTAQMDFWIFHAQKFKLLTKQWAMRSKSWWVVSNNVSGEWDYSLRSKRVACVQRDQMYYSFNVLYLVPYHIIANISSAEAHPQHQYTTLPLTFKRNTNKLWRFTLFLIETLAVRHRSGFLSHMSL